MAPTTGAGKTGASPTPGGAGIGGAGKTQTGGALGSPGGAKTSGDNLPASILASSKPVTPVATPANSTPNPTGPRNPTSITNTNTSLNPAEQSGMWGPVQTFP